MAEFIEILSPSALKDLREANLEVVKLVANIDKVGQNMAKISTPSGSDNATKKLAQDYQELQKQLANTQKQLERNRLAEIKLAQDREKAFDKYERNLAKEEARLNASQNLYNKVQTKLNALSNEYKALATKKELTNKLTQEEEKRYTFLQSKIQTYDKTLKVVDATMGKYQRNVGNYASGFNPLSNSINQLTREMPAFTYSVQTGFMALSNNIPIFTDAISNAIAQNKELQAQGKPTTSVLSQLAGAFVSWQTLMGIGITLLTVYGKEIGAWFSNISKGKDAIDAQKEAQRQLNEVNLQGQKNAVEESLKVKSLLAIAKDSALSYKERTIAVKELQDTYPAYFGNLEREKILAGQTSQAEKELTNAILSRAKANAAIEKITENQSKIIDFDIKRIELQTQIKKLTAEIEVTQKKLNNAESVSNAQGLGLSQKIATRNKLLSDLVDITKERNNVQLLNNTLTSFAIEKQKEAILLDYKEEKSKNIKSKRENIEAIKLEDESLKGLINTLTALKSALEKQRAEESQNKEQWDKSTKAIEAVQRSIDGLTTGYKDLTQTGVNEFLNVYGKRANQASQNTEELEKALQSLFRTTANSTLSSFGMDSLIPMFDGTFNKMWETANTFNEKFAVGMKYIGDVAKETFAFISQQQQAQYEQQYQRLEQERDVALMFAGESATARQEIEEQYERRRAAIQRRQAQAQKKMAIFNSIINTAQGVTSALAMANIPLAIAIGVIGAVQTAMIASQQIPQFWKGTDDAPEGWAWTQEKGREIITDKQGRVKSTGSDKGAQLTYLNKGDKVYTASETESLMFNNSLNNMLLGSGIMMPKVEVSMDTTILGSKIDNLANTIANKPSFTFVKDAKGERVFMRKQAELKEIQNARLTITTYDV